MALATAPAPVVAEHGEKMIELRIKFWTNDIAEDKNMIAPKHAWSSGVVSTRTNKAHGLTSDDPIIFNSLLELPSKIEELLIREGITLHLSEKYLQA